MKTSTFFTPFLFVILLLVAGLQETRAQQNANDQQIAIPLSNPGQPGSLNLGVVRGSITVTGYDGDEVLINYGGEDASSGQQEVTRQGLRRISDSGIGFEVTEDNNEVHVGSVSPMRSVDFRVSVPRNFALHLSTVNGGEIRVENVSGEMEISNVNGPITLVNVGGSVVANTVNGDISATFRSVAEGKPMAFTNLNGDIDVTFPAGVRMNARMRSEWGEVFTDFDMDLDRTGGVDRSGDSGTYKVSVNHWINGAVNGGGPEYQFRSMRGDIYIRRQ